MFHCSPQQVNQTLIEVTALSSPLVRYHYNLLENGHSAYWSDWSGVGAGQQIQEEHPMCWTSSSHTGTIQLKPAEFSWSLSWIEFRLLSLRCDAEFTAALRSCIEGGTHTRVPFNPV